MFAILRHRTYRHLFLAQVVALAGTGLATIALGLLAFDLAGGQAGAVLGTALAIKMAAYVLVAPLAGAYLGQLPRRSVLVGLDVVRLAVVPAPRRRAPGQDRAISINTKRRPVTRAVTAPSTACARRVCTRRSAGPKNRFAILPLRAWRDFLLVCRP